MLEERPGRVGSVGKEIAGPAKRRVRWFKTQSKKFDEEVGGDLV